MTAKRIGYLHVLQGDGEEEVEEPGAVDVELRGDNQEREVEEMVEPEEEVEPMKGVEPVEEALELQEVVGEVVEGEDWNRRRMLSKDKLGSIDKCR